MINNHIHFNESFEDIQKAFSYTIYKEDPKIILKNIIFNIKKYIKKDNIENDITKAYNFAINAHGTQKRLSGELYITHPLKATEILLWLYPDIKAIQACILHDVIEDTNKTYEDVKNTFGEEVANLCEGLSKVSNVRYGNNEKQLETIKKTFLAMAKDLRVIFIKLADRIHNIQTLHFHPKKEKQIKIATETMKIYVPIAKRLGLFKYAIYLENGCFKILHPKEYDKILKYYGKKYSNVQKHIKQGILTLTKLLKNNGINDFNIKGRIKSPYRIWRKLNDKYMTNDFDKVLDILAFRIITKNISDCYNILGIIHGQRRPIINKIKDYIAVPKFNNYQSLHTTILGMYIFPVEIQIRTKKMDEIAEFGVAAHCLYAEKGGSVSLNKKQSMWIKELQSVVSSYTSLSEIKHQEKFKENLNIELLHKNIFVYTPKGDIFEIPKNATVLDFAFRIHSDIGLRFKNALVNGIIKPINFIPKTGDVIKINTFRNKYVATNYWIDFLHTPSAKAKLTKFLKEQNKENLINNGKKILEEKLLELGLENLGNKNNLIVKNNNKKELEKIYIEISDKQKTALDIIKIYYKNILINKKNNLQINNNINNKKTNEKLNVIIDNNKDLDYSFCSLCSPKHNNKIIAKTGINGIKIHNVSCSSIKKISFNKLLEAHREGKNTEIYNINLLLNIKTESGGLVSLMSLLNSLHLDIENISFTKKDLIYFTVKLECSYKNPSKVGIIIKELNKYSNIKILNKDIK